VGRVKTAIVLGGGGVLGAFEVGMLRALAEAGIQPDVVVGTSVGAINGVFVAAGPDSAAARLDELWQGADLQEAFSENFIGRITQLVRSGTHLHAVDPLRRLLERNLPAAEFAGLRLPFQCVAARIEGARATWFSALTGEKIELPPADGPVWTSPAALDKNDWALLLQAM
jgi:NTE family protein